jgi:hypothetical protein
MPAPTAGNQNGQAFEPRMTRIFADRTPDDRQLCLLVFIRVANGRDPPNTRKIPSLKSQISNLKQIPIVKIEIPNLTSQRSAGFWTFEFRA